MLKDGSDSPHPPEVIIRGLGGVGKTQLAIEYAKRLPTPRSSVFFLNAGSEASLVASFRWMASIIFPRNDHALDDHQDRLDRINGWLSDPQNKDWLLIFDGYDDPDQFEIMDYYPSASHGSIIVTAQRSNQPQRVITVQPIENTKDSVAIFRAWSGRPFSDSGMFEINLIKIILLMLLDPDVIHLVNRLNGLPLAIATFAECLRGSTITPRQLLQAYNNPAEIKQLRQVKLFAYPGRTLYTTWDRSYDHLKKNHPNCAKLLELLGYFSCQRLWYELFHIGVGTEHPEELQKMMGNEMRFDLAMKTLEHYSFIEIGPDWKSWTMYPCVHDWLLTKRNNKPDLAPLQYAFGCIAKSLSFDNWDALGCSCTTNLALHAAGLVQRHPRQGDFMRKITSNRHFEVWSLASLLYRHEKLKEAKKMLKISLEGVNGRQFPDENHMLATMHSIGKVYTQQGKLEKAEQIFEEARVRGEDSLGIRHPFTLLAVQGLAEVYQKKGRLTDAAQMIEQVRDVFEPRLGSDCLLVEHESLKPANSAANRANNQRQSSCMSTSLLEWALWLY